MQIGSCGAFGDIQHLSDFCVLISFHVVQHDDGALSSRKGVERHRESLPQFAIFGGVSKWRGHGLREFVGVANFATTRDIECRVSDDAMQPRPKCLIGEEASNRAIRVQKCFLHRIFRVLVINHDCASHRIRTPLVATDEFGKRCFLSALGGEDERLLIRRPFSHGATG